MLQLHPLHDYETSKQIWHKQAGIMAPWMDFFVWQFRQFCLWFWLVALGLAIWFLEWLLLIVGFSGKWTSSPTRFFAVWEEP
jgi:hypothetical protein